MDVGKQCSLFCYRIDWRKEMVRMGFVRSIFGIYCLRIYTRKEVNGKRKAIPDLS